MCVLGVSIQIQDGARKTARTSRTPTWA